jgi:hypothetical protein
MGKKIKIDKTSRVIVDGRMIIDIDAVQKRFGGKMTKNGLSIPKENIEVHKSEDGTEYVWLPFKGDGISAEVSIPLNRLTNKKNSNNKK